MATSEHINPRILSWARETAGLSVFEAAEKLGLKDTVASRGVDKLANLERGDTSPTSALLNKAASVYRRPLIAFYLAEPPARGERGEDFRASAGSVSTRDNGMLDTLLRDIRARQQMLREVLVEEEEAEPLSFVGSASVRQDPEVVVRSIRGALGVTLADQRAAGDAGRLFVRLRRAAEKAGVYVLVLGDLGSHHSDIGEDVFRGFALSDSVAPFVVINDNDAAPARSFTLMHELAHIWIGASGVSGSLREMSSNAVERFCNSVAGLFLLPKEATTDLPKMDTSMALDMTSRVASTWNVSQGVVAFRLLQSRLISDDTASELFSVFAERWKSERQRVKDNRSTDESGPGYYHLRRSGLGPPLLNAVRRALQGDVLTHTKAAKILGVKPASVNKLLEKPRAA